MHACSGDALNLLVCPRCKVSVARNLTIRLTVYIAASTSSYVSLDPQAHFRAPKPNVEIALDALVVVVLRIIRCGLPRLIRLCVTPNPSMLSADAPQDCESTLSVGKRDDASATAREMGDDFMAGVEASLPSGTAMTANGPVPFAGNILDSPDVVWMDDCWTKEEVRNNCCTFKVRMCRCYGPHSY